MTRLENSFETIFKTRGGRHQGQLAESPLFKHALKLARSWISAVKGLNSPLPDPYIDVIANSTLNACATKSENTYFIAIHAGTIILIYTLFLRMMSSKNIFAQVGDISKEPGINKIYSAELTNLEQLIFVTDPNESIGPVSQDRRVFAQILSDIVIEFLVSHEYAHIIYGHVDYKHSILGTFEINEGEIAMRTGQSPDPLISQTLEMDADSGATNWGLASLNRKLTQPELLNPQIRQFYRNWPDMLKMWVFAVYTFFRIIGHQNDVRTMQTYLHPPPSVRAHLILGNICTIFERKYDTSILNQIPNICVGAARHVENMFAEISEQGLDLAPLTFSTRKDAFDHGRSLMRNWNIVRPQLAPFAHTQLMPEHVDEDKI